LRSSRLLKFLLNYFKLLKLLKRWFVYIAVCILLYDVVRRCVVDVETVKALVML
jgi:hypothetical protein